MLLQATSLAGAFLILFAYAAHQAGKMSRATPLYHVTNALGGGLLLVVAVAARQAGFIVLEGVWTLISLAALVRGRRSEGGA